MRLIPYINAVYSLAQYGVVDLSRHVGRTPMPFALSVELTNRCNLHCPCCATGAGLLKRPSGFMDKNTLENVAVSLEKYVLAANLYFQGEPMLHPDFFDITERLRCFNSTISTNGHFLNDENCKMLSVSGLKKIIVSYDGVTPGVYGAYRKGGDLLKVTEGIKCLSTHIKRQKNAPSLELLFLYGKHNAHEINEVRKFAGSVNASFKVKSMQVSGNEDFEKWIPDESRLSRYIKDGDSIVLRKRPARGCIRMWTTAVITWDGTIVPCCFDKDATFGFGNINEQQFSEIWNGKARQAFLSDVIMTRDSHSICQSCPQGMKLFF